MNKVASVSFKGIKNVGGQFEHKDSGKKNLRIAIQLTDDETKDLTFYHDIFERFPDPRKKGFLILDNELAEEKGISYIENFKINGKILNVTKENFIILRKLWTLLNDIQGKAIIDRDLKKRVMLPIEKSYLESEDYFKNYDILGKVLDTEIFVRKMYNNHKFERVEACAESFKKALQFALIYTK